MTQMWILRYVLYTLEVAAVQILESVAVVACAPDFEAACEVVLVLENVEVRLSTIGDCGRVIALALLGSVLSGLTSEFLVESALLLLN